MATKIRRCLYIGLGGTGMSAILNTKKMYIDTYGKVPDMVGFLGIDTDENVYNKVVYTRTGEEVSLLEEEQRRVSLHNPKNIYEANQASLAWFPKGPLNERNVRGLRSLDRGAGQIRSNGRFAMWYYWKNVVEGIQKRLEKITEAQIVDDEEFNIWDASAPEIHVVFSVCGGTGCGTFINLGYLLEEHIKPRFNYGKVIAYGVMPGVFRAERISGLENIEANAFGALEDMDWLMSCDFGHDEFLIESLNDTFYTNESPYKVFMLVENRNPQGDTYRRVDEISQMLSLALLTASSELADAGASFYDNIVQHISAGDMDVAGKRAWASGLGVSEITIHSEILGEIYAKKAAQKIIGNLLSEDENKDAEDRASKWIDSPEVNIRENNNRDAVIDFILTADPQFRLPEILNKMDVEREVEEWLNTVSVDDNVVQNRVKELTDRTKNELRKLYKEELNKPHGVKDVYKIFYSIKSQIEACKKEMDDELGSGEKKGFVFETPILKNELATAEKEYKEYKRGFFSKNETVPKMNAVIEVAYSYAVNLREIHRRNAANLFYSTIITELENYLTSIDAIEKQLDSLDKDLENKVANTKESCRKYEQLFQIDLTKDFLEKVHVENSEDDIVYFLNNNSLESIATAKKSEEVENTFLSYTRLLNKAQQWFNKTIDDVLSEMSTGELTEMIRKALRKSSELLNFDYELHGQQPTLPAAEEFYIGVKDKTRSVLKESGLVEKQLKAGKNVDYCNIGSKNSIIFYRQIGVVPPFTLPVLSAYQEAAEKAKEKHLNVHFDIGIEGMMVTEGYNIYPPKATDESLDLWVKGFLFKKIRNDGNGHYQYIDLTNKSRATEGYWVNIPHPNPSMRDQAFSMFSDLMRDDKKRKNFKTMIETEYRLMGDTAFKQLLADLMKTDEYFDKYSMIGLQRKTIEQPYYKLVKKQISEEIYYVQNDLQQQV